MTDSQIASMLGRQQPGVKTKRQELGLAKDKAHRKYSFEDVKKEFAKTDYILLSDESDYKDAATNSLRYLCPRHIDKGILSISLGHLKDGRGCYYCGREVTENAHMIPQSKLERDCHSLCETKGFIYVGVERSEGRIIILYICPFHKEVGIQKMRKNNMERDYVCGCPYCVDTKKYKFSKGEETIANLLDELEIRYIRQYRFDGCRDQDLLPFDFYLPSSHSCIEYDGQHHFYPVCFNGITKEEAEKNHMNTVKHDEIKNFYCKFNSIPLLRIPYYDFNNIDEYIYNFLNIERGKYN